MIHDTPAPAKKAEEKNKSEQFCAFPTKAKVINDKPSKVFFML